MTETWRTEDGIIVDPGKFEGEPLWVPYLWDRVLSGDGEDHQLYLDFDGPIYTVLEIEQPDIDAGVPEHLLGLRVVLWESEVGFVGHRTDQDAINAAFYSED